MLQQKFFDILSKKKFQYFLFTHVPLALGLIFLDISVYVLLINLIIHLIILSPLATVTIHSKVNHDYIKFKNPLIEWIVLLIIGVYGFWRFTEMKYYHIAHHRGWETPSDPTANELSQGRLKYYIGITDPQIIPHDKISHSTAINFIDKYFFEVKLIAYTIVTILFGFSGLFYGIIIHQFYSYVLAKVHDITFHYSGPTIDRPWLFPIYFNDAYHLMHHQHYKDIDKWHWPYINSQYWVYKLLFK